MQFLHWLIKNCACAVCACAHTHIYTHIYVCNLQVLYLCIKYYLHLLYLCIKLFADTVPIFRKKFPDTISTWLTWKNWVFYYMIALQFFKKFNKKGMLNGSIIHHNQDNHSLNIVYLIKLGEVTSWISYVRVTGSIQGHARLEANLPSVNLNIWSKYT